MNMLPLIAYIALSLTIAACGASDQQADDPDSGAASATSVTSDTGMKGMEGMGGMMSAATMDSMHAHLQRMETADAEQVKSMLPTHRPMVANMLSRMNSEMRGMNMSSDARWTALTDSLRQDLTRMPEMAGAELKALMPPHHARVMRLMQMHRDMMGSMKH